MPDECGRFMKFPPPYKPSVTPPLTTSSSSSLPRGRPIQSTMDQTLKKPHPSRDPEKAVTETSSHTGRTGLKNTCCFLHFCEFISMVLSLVLFGLLILDIIKLPNVYFRTGNMTNTTSNNLTFNLIDWLISFEVLNISQTSWLYRKKTDVWLLVRDKQEWCHTSVRLVRHKWPDSNENLLKMFGDIQNNSLFIIEIKK